MKNAVSIIFILCSFIQCSKTTSAAPEENLTNNPPGADSTAADTDIATDNNVQDTSRAILFIRAFYQEYLTADMGATDDVRKKYCTPELLKHLSNSELDYDPFINAQDFDDNFQKTVSIQTPGENGSYTASYVDTFTKRKISIMLGLVVDGNTYRIDQVE